MNLVILRTNIETKNRVQVLRPVLDNHDSINRWSIDIEDVDNVLRIEAKDTVDDNQIITLIKKYGFYGEALED